MPRSRPASNPISFRKHTKQYYETRVGKRIYLGSDKEEALKKYYRLGLGLESVPQEPESPVGIGILSAGCVGSSNDSSDARDGLEDFSTVLRMPIRTCSSIGVLGLFYLVE